MHRLREWQSGSHHQSPGYPMSSSRCVWSFPNHAPMPGWWTWWVCSADRQHWPSNVSPCRLSAEWGSLRVCQSFSAGRSSGAGHSGIASVCRPFLRLGLAIDSGSPPRDGGQLSPASVSPIWFRVSAGSFDGNRSSSHFSIGRFPAWPSTNEMPLRSKLIR